MEILIKKITNTAVKADKQTLGQQKIVLFLYIIIQFGLFKSTKINKGSTSSVKLNSKHCSMFTQLLHALPHNHDTYCSIPMYTNKSVYNKAHLLHRENGWRNPDDGGRVRRNSVVSVELSRQCFIFEKMFTQIYFNCCEPLRKMGQLPFRKNPNLTKLFSLQHYRVVSREEQR